MAIKYLSINNDSINFNNIPKLDSNNVFDGYNTFNKELHVLNNSNDGKYANNAYMYLGNTVSYTETPTATTHGYLCMAHDNGHDSDIFAFIDLARTASNNSSASLCARNVNEQNDPVNDSIQVLWNPNIQRFTCTISTPPDSINNEEIATTRWVRALLRRLGLQA